MSFCLHCFQQGENKSCNCWSNSDRPNWPLLLYFHDNKSSNFWNVFRVHLLLTKMNNETLARNFFFFTKIAFFLFCDYFEPYMVLLLAKFTTLFTDVYFHNLFILSFYNAPKRCKRRKVLRNYFKAVKSRQQIINIFA